MKNHRRNEKDSTMNATTRFAALGAATALALITAMGAAITASGTVWFYDGIRNAGPDTPHDSAATTWANLGSGGATYDLARTERGNSWAEDGVWTDDGYVCKGRHVFAATGLSYTVPTSYTVQMLVDAKGAEQFVSWNAYLFCGSWNNFALYFATGDDSPKAKSISLNTQNQVGTAQGERPYSITMARHTPTSPRYLTATPRRRLFSTGRRRRIPVRDSTTSEAARRWRRRPSGR